MDIGAYCEFPVLSVTLYVYSQFCLESQLPQIYENMSKKVFMILQLITASNLCVKFLT